MGADKAYAKELAICFIYQLPVAWMGIPPDKDMISRTIDRQQDEVREEFRSLINQYTREIKQSFENPSSRAAALEELTAMQSRQYRY